MRALIASRRLVRDVLDPSHTVTWIRDRALTLHRIDGLAVRYLRQRWSPESKPVHAAHSETGR